MLLLLLISVLFLSFSSFTVFIFAQKVDKSLEVQENDDILNRTAGLVVYYDTNVQVNTYYIQIMNKFRNYMTYDFFK